MFKVQSRYTISNLTKVRELLGIELERLLKDSIAQKANKNNRHSNSPEAQTVQQQVTGQLKHLH